MAHYTASAMIFPISSNGVVSTRSIEFKDAVARATTVGGVRFLGETSTEIVDGDTINAVVAINGSNIPVRNGDVVVYNNAEFIYSSNTGWHEFGDLSGLGDLAIENTAEIDYTPEGSFNDFDVYPEVEEGAHVVDDIVEDAGSVTSGSADILTMTVAEDSEVLEISFTPSVPTAVVLPTFTQQNIMTGINSVTQPTFTGDTATLEAVPGT